jgi:hypothetical protein
VVKIVVLLLLAVLASAQQAPGFPVGFAITANVSNYPENYPRTSPVLPGIFYRWPGKGHVLLLYSRSEVDYGEEPSFHALRTTWNATVGVEAIPLPGHPYLAIIYSKNKDQTSLGDSYWDELGFGLGAVHSWNPFLSIQIQGEYLWIHEQDYLPVKLNSASRMSMRIGFLFYLL